MNTTKTLRTGLALLTLAIGGSALTHLPAAYAAPQAPQAPHSAMKMAASLSGTFAQVTHATHGTATLTGTGSKRTVRLSDFETGKGPQLKVYLVSGSARDNASIKSAIAGGNFVSLGALKSITGSQSYAVPASSKLGRGASIVIWCDKFNVAFGSATLS